MALALDHEDIAAVVELVQSRRRVSARREPLGGRPLLVAKPCAPCSPPIQRDCRPPPETAPAIDHRGLFDPLIVVRGDGVSTPAGIAWPPPSSGLKQMPCSSRPMNRSYRIPR